MNEQTLFVQDTNCSPRFPKRVHTILEDDGTEVDHTFVYNEKTEMPMHHAMKYLIDPAFVVADASGNRVRPQRSRSDEAAAAASLAPDEVIAKLDELTQGALFTRCKMRTGSGDIKPNTKKEKMIEFLTGATAEEEAPETGLAGVTGAAAAEAEDIDPDADNSDIFGDGE